jgi:transcriptional regulator with XRE-family HTH domain
MTANSRTFGEIIRERRRQLNLTQQQLAHLTGTSTSYLANIEGNRRRPSQKLLAKLPSGLEAKELILFTLPKIASFLSQRKRSEEKSVWAIFLNSEALRDKYNITDQELETCQGRR